MSLTTKEVIELARKHQNKGSMATSAQLCLSDAEHLVNTQRANYARERALTSLMYSVGVFHPDYKAAIKD